MNIEWYKRYAQSIMPSTHADLFRRYLFAYASVHTTWESNLALYLKIKDYDAWLGSPDTLKQLIIDSRAGLYNNRTKYISDFTAKFWANPAWYWKTDAESWKAYRDRIKDNSLGLGPAKSSFAVEMIYPTTAEVVCSDTHFLQWYGVSTKEVGKVSDKDEAAMEAHWVARCKELDIPSPIVRWAHWDVRQHRGNPRYWTHVLETPMTELRLEA